jgi:hypothetical protein
MSRGMTSRGQKTLTAPAASLRLWRSSIGSALAWSM